MNNESRMISRKKFIIISLLLLVLLPLPALADHIVDADLPTCAISFNVPSPKRVNDDIQITVTAADTSSGISSITINGALPTPTLTGTTSTTRVYSWTPTTAATYTITASVIDTAGNNIATATPCSAGYTYIINPAVGAWIQAVGDVHSNTGIHATGGP